MITTKRLFSTLSGISFLIFLWLLFYFLKQDPRDYLAISLIALGDVTAFAMTLYSMFNGLEEI